MAQIFRHRIAARQANLRRDSGQGGAVDGNCGHFFPGQTIRNRHRHMGRTIHNRFQGFGALVLGHGDQLRQLIQRLFRVPRFFAHHDHAVILFIGRQREPVAIPDQPARGRNQPVFDAVFIRQQPELIRLIHLQITHPRRKPRAKGQPGGAQQKSAPGDAACAVFIVFRGTSHQAYPPLLSRSPGCR